MRRLAGIVLAGVLLAAGIAGPAHGEEMEPLPWESVALTSVDLVARGAAVRVEFDLACQRGGAFTELFATVTQNVRGVPVATSARRNLVCTGEPQHESLLIIRDAGQPAFRRAAVVVNGGWGNCIDLGTCVSRQLETTTRVKRAKPEAPQPADFRVAGASLVNKGAGVQLTFDLTCQSGIFDLSPFSASIAQRIRGRVVRAGAGQDIRCNGEPQRVQIVVNAEAGQPRFTAKSALVTASVRNCAVPGPCVLPSVETVVKIRTRNT